MVLETEIARYNELLPELLAAGEGKFAVICGRDLVGIFESNDEAYTAGLNRVGVNPFLLRKILRVQPRIFLPTIFVSRKSA
jgi:hypothetical protein